MNNPISSDDPNAIALLREKLTKLEKTRDDMKAINTLLRKAKSAKGEAFVDAAVRLIGEAGYTFKRETIEKLCTPDFAGRIGFADYEITNSGSEARRLKGRIDTLTQKASAPAKEPEEIGSITITEADNRVKLQFPDKPAEEVRTELKRHGFKWTPSQGVWQRHASDTAWYWARAIARKVTGQASTEVQP
jgi:hypothetical protein